MDAIITITGTCTGGNHVLVQMTVGGVTKNLALMKSDLLSGVDTDFIVMSQEKALTKEIRRLVKRESITTFAALKIRCTNLSVSL